MNLSDTTNSVRVLYERSESLQKASAVLRDEARELCLASHRLRKTITLLSHNGNFLRYTSFTSTPPRDLTGLEIEKSLPKLETVDGGLSCELIKIRTPGFHRNPTGKIIKSEI